MALLEGLGLPAGVTFDSVVNAGAPAIPGVMHTNPDFKLTGGR